MPQVRGGIGIINPRTERPGTAGIIARRQNSLYILSCYHVLCRLDGEPFAVGEPIFLADDLLQESPVAQTELGIPDLDIAAARIMPGVEALTGVTEFPALGAVREPEEGMLVVKVGHATGRTEGIITRVEDDQVWIEPPDELQEGPISQGGDSGAIWIYEDDLSPVVLHSGTNDLGPVAFARGISLPRVLQRLELELPGA